MQRSSRSHFHVLPLEGVGSSSVPTGRRTLPVDDGADPLSKVWDMNFLLNDALSGAATRSQLSSSPQPQPRQQQQPLSSPSPSYSEESIRMSRDDNDSDSYTQESQSSGFRLSPTLDDHSTLLVEEWFRSVCSMWSGFDSAINMNRELARDAWARSEAVMHSLQSMSAICLSPQMPQLRQSAVRYLMLAVAAIQRDITASYESPSSDSATDLLFALCCVGTASCWVDTRIIGARFLRDAKLLLRRMNQRSANLSTQDRQKLYFFNNSITYWNMLVAVVSDEPDELGIPRLKNLTTTQLAAGQITPHPWTGISSTVQLLFMRTMKLCRQYRRYSKQSQTRQTPDIQAHFNMIEAACRVEEELLGLVHHQVSTFSDTGDSMSPILHLIDVAEAYRLASLLQLYQTFSDLATRRLPRQKANYPSYALWSDCITPLSFRLIEILKGIPASSGTRCIQPLLYLSAGTGLRFDPQTLTYMQEHQRGTALEPGRFDKDVTRSDQTPPASEMGNTLRFEEPPPPPPPITKQSSEVIHARRFVLGRFALLEHCLPPAPILVARTLIRKIWEAYDSERTEASHVHWIDVMEKSNLQTIFG